MRVAIPEYQGRVAPAFDSCRKLLIVDRGTGETQQIVALDWSSLPRGTRASRLKLLDVRVLICGGISNWLAEMVENEGIRVIPWVSGEIQEVIEAYFTGRGVDGKMAMPGWSERKTKGGD